VVSVARFVVSVVSMLCVATGLTVKEPMLEAAKVPFVAVAPTRYTPVAAVAGSVTLNAYTSRPPTLVEGTRVADPREVVVVAPGARNHPVTVAGLEVQTKTFVEVAPVRTWLGATTVRYPPVEGGGVIVEVYEKVVVPVAPLESVAVMTYVPVTHAELPPAFVAYEKVPVPVTETVCASRTLEEPTWFTEMKTLSGSVGVGEIVPLIV
jgi:hypothetical protein